MNFGKTFIYPNALITAHNLAKNFPYPRDSIESIQFKKLKRLLCYAYRNIRFYRNRMNDAGFSPFEFNDMEEFQKLPVLTKEEYKSYVEKEVSVNPEKYDGWYKESTSGSTGTPMQVYRTWRERSYSIAKWIRAIQLNGYSFTFKTCYGGYLRKNNPDSWIQALGIGRRKSISFMGPLDVMIEEYKEAEPDFFYANKTHIFLMAREIMRQNIQIKQPSLYAVASETLDENSRAVIQRVFGTSNMFEVYGAIELGGNLAFQMKGRDGLYFSHDTDILELDNNGTMNNREGFSIVTDLHIWSFPLIRYRLGDWLEMEKENDDFFSIIKRIRGREEDLIYLPNGKKLPYLHFSVIMRDYPHVQQFRIIQEDIKSIKIQLVLQDRREITDIQKTLTKKLSSLLECDMYCHFEFPEQLLPDPNGKLRMVINKLDR